MSIPSRPSTALGAVLLGGLGLSASALAMTDLAQGYALDTQAVTPPSAATATDPAPMQSTAKTTDAGSDAKATEGSYNAHAKKAAAPTQAGTPAAAASAQHDDKAMAEGKCGEGKCGGGG
jgi:hypothetical protein